jgi:excisionase family DNA binding protein
MKETYTVDEVAVKFGVNRETVARMIKANKLTAFKTGRMYRIPKTVIDEMLDKKARV